MAKDDKKTELLALLDEDLYLIAQETFLLEANALGKNKLKAPSELSDKILAHAKELISQFEKTTADAIESKLGEYENGDISASELSDAIDSIYGSDRAAMIAATASTAAISIGALSAFYSSGIEAMLWITERDERVDEICRANEDVGAVLLGDEFPSGDLHPPAHPNCRCYIKPVIL